MLSGCMLSDLDLEPHETKLKKTRKKFIKNFDNLVNFAKEYESLCYKYGCCFEMIDYDDCGVMPATKVEIKENLANTINGLYETKRIIEEIEGITLSRDQ